MTTQQQIGASRQNIKLGGDKKLIKRNDKKAEIERVRRVLTESIELPDNEMVEEYVKLNGKNKLTPKEKERERELLLKITMLNGVKNGFWVGLLSHIKHFDSLTKIRSSLVKEYNCKTSIELMLIDRIVASYWRAMRCDMVFNHLIEDKDGNCSFDQLKVNIIKEFNKGTEIANRQLNANIILLKELKAPSLEINVRTKTAFVARNQQLNINPPNKTNPNKDENIEPK